MTNQKTNEEKLIAKIKQLYTNYGVDVSTMEEEEFKRLFEFYKDKPAKLTDDLKKSSVHAGGFSDADII